MSGELQNTHSPSKIPFTIQSFPL